MRRETFNLNLITIKPVILPIQYKYIQFLYQKLIIGTEKIIDGYFDSIQLKICRYKQAQSAQAVAFAVQCIYWVCLLFSFLRKNVSNTNSANTRSNRIKPRIMLPLNKS